MARSDTLDRIEKVFTASPHETTQWCIGIMPAEKHNISAFLSLPHPLGHTRHSRCTVATAELRYPLPLPVGLKCLDIEEMNPLKLWDKNRTPGGVLTAQFWKLKLKGVIPEHCANLICPKGEDALNCAVNVFHATVERYASNKPVTLLDGYSESHKHFSRFCEKKNINTRCVCDGQRVIRCFRRGCVRKSAFLIKIHLAATQNVGL